MLQPLSGGWASGPSATAEWSPLTPGGERAPLRALPDAANETTSGRLVFHVVSEPVVTRGPGRGAPLFSLTLILSRQPLPNEESILGLVTGGVCAMTMTVLPAQAELSWVGGDSGQDYRPLFPRRASWILRRDDDPVPLVQRTDEGASGQGAFSFSLGREEALEALAALRGDGTSLVLECELVFRAVTARLPSLRVTIDHVRVYDALAGSADAQGLISEGNVIGVLVVMVEEEAILVEGVGSESATGLVHALLEALLRALLPILRRAESPPGEPQRMFRLGPRPMAPMSTVFQQASGAATVERTVHLFRPLRDALSGLLSEYSMDAFVRLVCPGSDGTLQPIFRRLPATRSGPPGEDGASPLASIGSTAAAMPAVLKTSPSLKINAHALLASDLVLHPVAARRQQAWVLDDLIVDRLSTGAVIERHLPVIDRDESQLWPDRISADQFWYAPELFPVQPEVTAQACTSPFLFSFKTVGHDAQGRPGIEATVRVTLRQRLPADPRARGETRGRQPPQPVPLNGLSASLEIPFRDEQGRTQTQAVTASSVVTAGTDVVVTFQLTDQWARLCYGALAVPGFQQETIRIVTSYTFPAYVPVNAWDGRIAWGGKQALTEVAMGPAAREGIPGRPVVAVLAQATALSPMVAHATLAHPVANVAVHAPLTVAPNVSIVAEKTYGIRSQGRTGRQELLMPCTRFGALYVQVTDEGEVAIGCRDAFAIGQIELRLYERIEIDLGIEQPGLRVYRSLQVPGRFLIVPTAYTIARFEPGDSRGYRPAIYLFSSVDAEHPERGNCILMATLQPAVPPFRRRQLLDALRQQAHPNPTLEWPTELASTPVYTWALGDAEVGHILPKVVKTPEGFQVNLTAPLESAMQLKAMVERAGVSASVRFPLGDGSSIETILTVDLTRIEGPWLAGPLEVSRSGGSVTLVNRVEQALAVSGLLLYTGGAPTGEVPVERRLAAGESLTVDKVPSASEFVPRYALAGGASSLDEVRTFIEDIYTNVVFMSSVDFAALGLTELTIEASVNSVPGTSLGRITATSAMAELRFVLPLTVYLAAPTLQFRISARAQSGAVTVSPWKPWRLDTLGNVIPITANLLQGG